MASSTCTVHWIELWCDIRISPGDMPRGVRHCVTPPLGVGFYPAHLLRSHLAFVQQNIYRGKTSLTSPSPFSSYLCEIYHILTRSNTGSWKTKAVQGTSLPFKGSHMLWVGMVLIYFTSSCEAVKKPRKVVGPFDAIMFCTS